jgi:hypothetical protein
MAALPVPDHDLLQMTECAAQGMIRELGYERQRSALQSVEGFQIIWNSLLPDVRAIQGVHIPSQNGGKLVVDGLYGSQSATAANNFVQTPLPSRAVDVPVWFAQNQDMVAAMCAPAPPIDPVPMLPQDAPVVVVPNQLALAPPPELEAYVAPAEMEPIIEAQMPQAPPPFVVLPAEPVLVEVVSPQQIKDALSQGPIAVDSPSPPGLVDELPPATIYARPRTADVPVLAIAVGALVVAGITGYWLFGRKKKR